MFFPTVCGRHMSASSGPNRSNGCTGAQVEGLERQVAGTLGKEAERKRQLVERGRVAGEQVARLEQQLSQERAEGNKRVPIDTRMSLLAGGHVRMWNKAANTPCPLLKQL
eukprot:412547-Prorocentrum_minimum.AAC.1